MSIDKVDKALQIVWNIDENGNRQSIPIFNEPHTVINNKITLLEIPDEFYGVTIKDGETVLSEVDPTDTDTLITADKFRVHYGLGIIFLHESTEGKSLKISYSSRGGIMYPATRIYTDVNEVDGSVTNLQEVIDDVEQAKTELGNINDAVKEGQRVEVELASKITDGDQTVIRLHKARDSAEAKKVEVESTTADAETERQNLISKTSEANVSYNALHDKITEAEMKRAELDNHTDLKKADLDTYVGDSVNPATGTKKHELDTHTIEKSNQLDTYTLNKQTQIDSYVTGKENQLNSHTGDKELQLDSYTNDKKTQLESHTLLQETSITDFTSTKQGELDIHCKALETTLDNYKDDKKLELDTHTQMKKNDLDSYVGNDINPQAATKKADLNVFADAKKVEIDAYVGGNLNPKEGTIKKDINNFISVKKQELDTYSENNKKTDLDAHTAEKMEQMEAYKDEKLQDINNYIGSDVNPAEGTKKKELDNYTINKRNELDEKIGAADTSKISLEGSISSSVTAKTDLDNSIASIVTAKGDLDGSIASATAKKKELDVAVTTADARHVTLSGDIEQADSKIAEMDNLNQRMSLYEDYNGSKTYYSQNKVIYLGDTYLVLKEVTGITPVDDGINYRLIVQGVTSNDANAINTDTDHRFVTDSDKLRWNDTYTQNEVDNKISQVISNMDWKEAVESFADLSKIYPDAVEGWSASVNDEDVVYRYDGTEWKFHSGGELPLATPILDGKMSAADKTKLDGIESGANNYTHPSNHSLDEVVETATKKIMTNTERNKLAAIDDNANNYVHPTQHQPNVIETDANHRWLTDTQIANWDSKAKGVHTHSKNDITDLSLSWSSITNKPSSYAPSTHTHEKAQIADWGVTWSEITGRPADYTPSSHTHTESEVVDLQNYLPLNGGMMSGDIDMNNQSLIGVDKIKIHESGYNEGIEWVDGVNWRLFDSPNDLSNGTGNLQITTGSTRRYTFGADGVLWVQNGINVGNKLVSLDDHTHIQGDITDFDLSWENITNKPIDYTPSSHLHDDRYYTESEINTLLSNKANSLHTHGAIKVDDTRSVNAPPSSYNNEFTTEFKDASAIDSPNGQSSYCGLMTFAPWGDNSGGRCYQLAFTQDENIALRTNNLDDSSWTDAWKKIWHEGNFNPSNIFSIGTTQPDSTKCKLWLDTTATPYTLKYWNGTQWRAIDTYQ